MLFGWRVGLEMAGTCQLLSDDHFSIDGTLIGAWASHKSLRHRDDDNDSPGGGSAITTARRSATRRMSRAPIPRRN